MVDDAQVNIPAIVDISQLNQPDSKSLVDDMIDAVVTKYSAQVNVILSFFKKINFPLLKTSRLSPTHHQQPAPQIPQQQTIEEISAPKIKTKIQPERLLDDLFSPIKVTDNDEPSKQIPMKTPQLKLKIPLNRPLNEQQLKSQKKVNKGEKKGLKLIIDKKRVINTSEQPQQQLNDNESEMVLDLSIKSSKDELQKKSETLNSISFNIDEDDDDNRRDAFNDDDDHVLHVSIKY